MPDAAIPEPWGSFLRELEEIATARVDFHCIGGFLITRKYGFQRETSDVDVLSIAPKAQVQDFVNRGAKGSDLHRKYGVYLDLFGVIDAYPDDYPAQLEHIRLLAAEAHDLALMKLGRNIERDRADVKFLARQRFITREELRRRYEKETRPYIALREERSDPVVELWVEMIREELDLRKAIE
jgi:hypothetical protein